MAERNIVRQDVVQITWDVEPAPFGEVDRQLGGLTGGIGDVTKGMKTLDRSADKAGDAIEDVVRQGKKLGGIPADDAARDMKDLAGGADKAKKSLWDVGREKLSTLLSSLGKVEDRMKSVTGLSGDLAKGIKGMAGTALGAVGVGLGVKELADTTAEYQKSVNQLQARTGMSDAEREAMSGSIRALYADNMGESFEDIAASMSQVKAIMGASGKALEGMTYNAILMRDTFDFDVNESVRSADMLMRQFGLSGNQAFSMIAQGAQAGLDKNGNLLDSLNEYSVHFRQLGFSGEEMMNMLANSAQMGVFDVDKIGDALKEFGIRSKDASKSTYEIFESMGLNATYLTDAFAHGGEAAQDAFRVVTGRLKEMKDETAQNAAGVALFGTMWEDMGADAVLALTNTTGQITKSTKALEKINAVQYNDLGSALSALGRTVVTEVVLPLTTGLGEDFTAAVNNARGYIADFGAGLRGEAGAITSAMGQVGLMFRAVGGVIGAVFGFAVRHANIVVPAILAIVTAMAVWKVVSTAVAAAEKVKMVIETIAAGKTIFAAGAQWLMNTAMYACPAVWLVAVLLAVVAVIGLLIWGISSLVGWLTGANDGMEDFGSTMRDFAKQDFTQDFTVQAGMEGDLAGDYNRQLDGMQGQSVGMTAELTPTIADVPEYGIAGPGTPAGGASTIGEFSDRSGFNDSAEPDQYMTAQAMNVPVELTAARAASGTAAPGASGAPAGQPYHDVPQYAPEGAAQTVGNTTSGGGGFVYSPTIHVQVSGTPDDAQLEEKITVRVRKVLRDEFEAARRKHPRLIEA